MKDCQFTATIHLPSVGVDWQQKKLPCKEQMRFNLAADIEIGYLLEKAGIVDLSIAKESWGDMLKGYPAERIYNMLQVPKMKNEPPPLTGKNTVRCKSSDGKTSEEKNKDGKQNMIY